MDKNVYTIKEVDELKAWAEQAEFPAEMQLDKAVYILDVKETVRLLERIKARVEEEKRS